MRWWLVLFLCLGGCEGCGAESPHPENAATPSTEPSTGSTEEQASAGEETAPGTPEHVAVRSEVDRYGHVTLAVENRGDEVARIAPQLRIAGAEALPLKIDCDGEPPACVELAPGAVLYPCDCAACDDVPAGATFHLTTCGQVAGGD